MHANSPSTPYTVTDTFTPTNTNDPAVSEQVV